MTETQDWTPPASRVRFSFLNFNLTIVLLYLILSTSTMLDSLGPMGYGRDGAGESLDSVKQNDDFLAWPLMIN